MKKKSTQKNMPQTSGFSRFFREASAEERRKVFLRVLKKASQDQRRILEGRGE
jgi:hypothetical protein